MNQITLAAQFLFLLNLQKGASSFTCECSLGKNSSGSYGIKFITEGTVRYSTLDFIFIEHPSVLVCKNNIDLFMASYLSLYHWKCEKLFIPIHPLNQN